MVNADQPAEPEQPEVPAEPDESAEAAEAEGLAELAEPEAPAEHAEPEVPAEPAAPPAQIEEHTVEPGSVKAAGVLVGKVVTATVASVGEREVELRLVDGRTGVVAADELSAPAVGQEIEGALLAREDSRGRVWLSATWAAKQRAWERVEAALADHSAVSGTVAKATKGGFVVDVGLRAFLPYSLLGSLGPEEATLAGREVEVLVTECDRHADRVVVSVRDLERRRRREQERERIKALSKGDRIRGRVVSIADYGAVVDLGGARGLVHRSELTWGRLGKVEDHVTVGEEYDVVVLDVNHSKKRIGLSIRRLSDDPFADVQVGQIVSATVTRVVDYGVFTRLDEGGAEGLVHISELSDVPGFRPDQLVTPGEQLMVKVLDVDRRKRRMSLSVRRVLVDD